MGEYARKLRARLAGKGMASARAQNVEPPLMTNREFHTQRRMFCVVDGKAHVADQADARYHREWMDALIEGGVEERVYARSPRGYYLAPDMVWYRGPFSPVGMRDIREHLQELVDLMDLPPDTRVYSGARPGYDDVLKGETLVGTIEDIVDIAPAAGGETP